MRKGFLDDLPDLDLPEGQHKETNKNPKSDKENHLVVIYELIRCPRCKSTKAPVTCTKLPIRYHKCRACGLNFKSIDQASMK
jgi:hypothetical protein